MNILAVLRQRFETALAGVTDQPRLYAEMVKPVQDARFGDFQANFAMPLAKQLGKPPRDIAQQIADKVELSDLCQPPEIAGPGFINLRLRDDWLEQAANRLVGDERLGVAPVTEPRTYVVDFSAPNVAKPMHVGHLRSTVLGDALCRILRFLGHRVIGDNHIGDWGTQFGMIIFGYKHFLNQQAFDAAPVAELARLYRLVNRLSDYHELCAKLPKLDTLLAEKMIDLQKVPSGGDPNDKKFQKEQKKRVTEVEDLRKEIADTRRKVGEVDDDPQLLKYASEYPDIATQARLETARLHAGDPGNTALWNQFVPACLQAIQGVYDRLDIHFDHALGESYYQPMLADVVADLQQRGLAQESEGAICVFIPGVEAPFIIRKSDGAYTYATTDLATIKHRVDHWNADALLYVVDARQADHFRLLFETVRLWGYGKIELKHVSFGTICGPDGKPYKTRAGDTVGLESLLDEAIVEARKEIEKNAKEPDDKRPALDPEQHQHVAEVVGLGGIKYADLKHNRESDYVFSWDKMLTKNGDTATYLQYAYARCFGIFRKGETTPEAVRSHADPIVVTHPAERALALQLARFPETLEFTVVDYRPNLLTEYLYQTAVAFTTFFENCPVLKAEQTEVRNSRLKLADLTARTMKRGMSLLGIEAIEQM